MKSPISLFAVLSLLHAAAAPLTMKQTAQIAYNAGFRGGSLVTAVAVAEAESGLEPLAVSNNYALQDHLGNPLLASNGRQRIEGVPGLGASAIVPVTTPPPPAVPLPSLGAHGVIRHHCLGLWQLNDGIRFRGGFVTDGGANLLDPAVNAQQLFTKVTSRGRHWWRFISVMRGTPWEPDRLARARNAALQVDPSVLPSQAVNLRVRVLADFGNVRQAEGGTVLRKTRIGDTGTVTEGPVIHAIRDGAHSSLQPCYHVRWDYGIDGWVPEYLIALEMPGDKPLAAHSPSPRPGKRCVPWYPQLDWQRGSNAVAQIVRLSESAADLDLPSSIRATKGIDTGYTFTNKLAHAREYFWRVDTMDTRGSITRGPVWSFRTQPLTVSFSNFTVSHNVWPANRRVTISVRVHCPGEQRIVVGASFAGTSSTFPQMLNDPARETAMLTAPGDTGVLYTREFELPPGANPWGDHHFTLAAWLDWNGDGKVSKTDQQVSLFTSGRSVCGLWAMPHAPVRLIDTTPPVITGFTATPSVLNLEAMVPLTLRARITDGTGTGVQLVRASYRRNGGAQTLLPLLAWNVTGDLWQTTAHMPALPGDYLLSLHAMDAHESIGTASTSLRIADQSPPRLTVLSPLNGRAVPAGGSIFGNAQDFSALASIEYRMDGGAWASLPPFSSWNIPAPATAGPHTLELRATDAAGNVSPVVTHYFYVIGDPASPDTFDEFLSLDSGNVPQHWSSDFRDAPAAGLYNGRLEARDAPHTARLYRPKTVPAWVDTVELSFRLNGYGGVQWDDPSGARQWRVRVVPSAGAAALAIGTSQGQQSVNFIPGISMTCRALIRNGSIECRLVSPNEAPATLTVADPLLRLNTLNELSWQADGHGFSTSALDDLQIRGLRPENRFRILSAVPSPDGWRITCTSAQGRNYRLLSAPDPAGPWLRSFPASADGLLMEFTDPVTAPQPARRFWRVEELP